MTVWGQKHRRLYLKLCHVCINKCHETLGLLALASFVLDTCITTTATAKWQLVLSCLQLFLSTTHLTSMSCTIAIFYLILVTFNRRVSEQSLIDFFFLHHIAGIQSNFAFFRAPTNPAWQFFNVKVLFQFFHQQFTT